MIISKITITAFKSIQFMDLPIDKNITVLIGPNESGKTNILKAIESFNLSNELTVEQTCQYSELYTEGKPPIIAFELGRFSKEECAKLTKLYEGFRTVESFSLIKEGSGSNNYKIQTGDKILSLGNEKPLFDLLPKIIYFDRIQIIKDRVTLQDFQKGDRDYQTEINLLKIGGVEDPEIIFEDSTRGRRAAEETGKEITRRIRETWTQAPSLEIKLRVNGNLLYIDFSDDTSVYDTPKSRSPGFLWYLSFYINFIAKTNEAKANEYLFLLDEPGVHLHPSGQKDLTNLLENLSEKNQVIFTTHSPFMINRSHPNRVRVVDKTENGTQVDSEAYRENWRPLRQSIGLTVGDMFFFSSKGIPSDRSSKKSSLFKQK